MGNGTVKRQKQFFIRREKELEKAVRQFFFLYYPTLRKTNDKYISRSNAEDRDQMVKDMKKECFEELLNDMPHLEYLKDPDIPFCFMFVFNCFIEIFNHCHETMTWTDIQSYATLRNIKFKQIEISYILKCNSYANAQIKKMRDEEEEKAEGQT